MKNLYLVSIVAVLGIVYSCERDSSPVDVRSRLAEKNIVLNNNSDNLSGRITLYNQLMQVEELPQTRLKSVQEPPKVDLTKNYTFKLRAEVAPPQYNGHTLMATHVKIVDHFAFVTYNTKGNMYLGGLEVFDVTDLSKPKIVWQAIFSKSDVSAVDYHNNKLYIVGAHNIIEDKESKLRTPAMLQVLTLNSKREIQDVDATINLDSYAGTDVKVTSDGIYTTSGSNGFLKIYNHNYDSVYAVSINDARSVDLNSSNAFVLSGQPGKVSVFGNTSPSLIKQYYPEGGNTPESKSEIAVTDKYIYAALNEGGLKILNLDGSLKQYIPRPETPAGANDEHYVTNSVSLNGDLLFAANGQAGIYIGGIVKSRNDSVFSLGAIKFGEEQSSNFVESKDSVIFVATGLGGLKILSISIDEGVPDEIIPSKPCPILLTDIYKLFPGGKNNYKSLPDLFLPSNTKNIILKKESEVFITFLDEVADWRNSMGYYTYNLSDPPTSVDQLKKYILYPNVSKVNEGGGLTQGDMLRIGSGKFPANTVIGFYLIARGWKNGMVTNGLYTHYTNTEFNPAQYQQHTLFLHEACNELVMTFEDISMADKLSYSDNDFNDLIFVVTDNRDPEHKTPSTSFDVTNVPRK